MPQVIQAGELVLHDVEEKFHLVQIEDAQFFPEWQSHLPEITIAEQQWLDKVKPDFLSISKYPLHEEIAKMVVLSPLLSLAGFFHSPFLPVAEKQVEIALEDDDELVRGRIDVLVLHQRFWVTVIEAKAKQFSLDQVLPQALFYMMSSPNLENPTFGFITNGRHFQFIKLARAGRFFSYALSDEFSLQRRENELYQVLGVLRKLGGLVNH
jgi:hypothetical protein